MHVRKRGANTQWIAKKIAAHAKVLPKAIGYCGMKDRHAVTSQWFSVYLPKGDEPNWSLLEQELHPELEILSASRGGKKLRRGQHQTNAFAITLRNYRIDSSRIAEVFESIELRGVPNYFGEQRFGHSGANLEKASRWLDQGEAIQRCGPKDIIMSSARSYLFNLYLMERVKRDNWWTAIDGDVIDEAGAVCGPMWGRGRSERAGEAKLIEEQVYASLDKWLDGMEHCGLSQEGRPLAFKPQDLSWKYLDDVLHLSFRLLPGQYATAILRELAELQNCSIQASDKGDN